MTGTSTIKVTNECKNSSSRVSIDPLSPSIPSRPSSKKAAVRAGLETITDRCWMMRPSERFSRKYLRALRTMKRALYVCQMKTWLFEGDGMV